MADCYGGMLLKAHHGNGLPDDVRTAHNNDVFPGQVQADLFHHDHNPVRGAWLESWLADHKATDIVRVKSVDIFVRRDGFKNLFSVYMLGKRQLYKYAVYLTVCVQLRNQ